jgi:integrase
MARGKRIRIEPNIYSDQCGIAAKVQVGDYTREERWPHDEPLPEIRKWLNRTRAEFQALPGAKRSARGTLAQDAERYLRAVRHLASWIERRSEVRAWIARYGSWPRRKIHKAQILDARNAWLAAGLAPRTINHRVATLGHLFRELDGRRAPTPCDEIRPLNVPETIPHPVAPETILAVHANLVDQERRGKLRDGKTRARFMVLASSGVRASELMRAQPGDVDLEARIWRTRDGKGGHRPSGLYLHDDLLAAWRVFAEAEAWGRFETSAFARTLRTAAWPKGIRPYTLRHSVGIALSESGADLADVGAWLGHSRPETTRQHYVPVLAGRMRALGEAIGQWIGWPDYHENVINAAVEAGHSGGEPLTAGHKAVCAK